MTDFLSQLGRTVGAAFDIERELTGGGMSRVRIGSRLGQVGDSNPPASWHSRHQPDPADSADPATLM